MAWWLMPRTPDQDVGGSSPTLVKPCCVLEQGTFTPPKVLVIPRKRWLRPNLTGKNVYRDVKNQSTNMHGVKKESRLSTVIGLFTKHIDCRVIFMS